MLKSVMKTIVAIAALLASFVAASADDFANQANKACRDRGFTPEQCSCVSAQLSGYVPNEMQSAVLAKQKTLDFETMDVIGFAEVVREKCPSAYLEFGLGGNIPGQPLARGGQGIPRASGSGTLDLAYYLGRI